MERKFAGSELSLSVDDSTERTTITPGDRRLQITVGRIKGTPLTAQPFEPILMLGPRGSRKTSGLTIPALLEWPGPAIVSSIGGDVVEQTYQARNAVGKAVAFDPGDTLEPPVPRIGWSPLDHVESWDDAQIMAHVIMDAAQRSPNANPLWHDGGIMLLAFHLFAAAAKGYTMADVTRWIDTQEDFELRALLQAAGTEEAIVAAEATWQREQTTRNAIYAETQVSMSIWWRQKTISGSTTGERFAAKPFFSGAANTLYICSPPDARHDYRSLNTALAWALIRAGYEHNRGFASSLLGLRGPTAAVKASRRPVTPLLVVLDDAGSVAPIPDLNDLISTAAKAAIQVVTTFTDMSQIQAIYGEDTARSIVNSYSTVVILPGNHDVATAVLVEQLLGDEKPDGLPVGQATSEAIRRLPWGKALRISRNLPPVILDLRSSLADDDLIKLRGLAGETSASDRSK
jgi:type IV secretion system protein VirD4